MNCWFHSLSLRWLTPPHRVSWILERHVRVRNATIELLMLKLTRNQSYDGNPLNASLVTNLICLPDSSQLSFETSRIIRDKLVDKQDTEVRTGTRWGKVCWKRKTFLARGTENRWSGKLKSNQFHIPMDERKELVMNMKKAVALVWETIQFPPLYRRSLTPSEVSFTRLWQSELLINCEKMFTIQLRPSPIQCFCSAFKFAVNHLYLGFTVGE